MALRNYLRKDDLENLRNRMLFDGWTDLPPCGEWEVLRMWRNKQYVIVCMNASGDDFLSITHKDYPLIKHYLERK